MASIAIFAISGTAIITLLVAKRVEQSLKKPLFVFKWIMRSDERARTLYQRVLRLYSEGKEGFAFFFTKRIKLHSRNNFNKLITFLKEKREQYEHNMRNSRLLKKPDGISEFFKSISDVEKGSGTIDESLEDRNK